jgi:hypothetical protein
MEWLFSPGSTMGSHEEGPPPTEPQPIEGFSVLPATFATEPASNKSRTESSLLGQAGPPPPPAPRALYPGPAWARHCPQPAGLQLHLCTFMTPSQIWPSSFRSCSCSGCFTRCCCYCCRCSASGSVSLRILALCRCSAFSLS